MGLKPRPCRTAFSKGMSYENRDILKISVQDLKTYFRTGWKVRSEKTLRRYQYAHVSAGGIASLGL